MPLGRHQSMKEVRVRHLLDLVHADAPEPEKRLEKMFDWQIQRRQEIAKWLLGASVSLGVGIGVASAGPSSRFTIYHWAAAGIAIAVLLGAGVYQFARSHRLSNCYLSSVVLLNRLARLRPF